MLLLNDLRVGLTDLFRIFLYTYNFKCFTAFLSLLASHLTRIFYFSIPQKVRLPLNKLLKRFGVGILVLLLLAGLAFVVFKAFFDPYRATAQQVVPSQPLDRLLTQEQAREDLDFILKRLGERHPATLGGMPASVLDQYHREVDALPEQVSVLQVWQAASRITALMHDGHTGIRYHAADPVQIAASFEVQQGEILRRDGELAGSTLIAVNGTVIQELYVRYLQYASFELEHSAAYDFANRLPQKDFLELIGVDTTTNTVQMSYSTPTGEQTEQLTFQAAISPQTAQEEPFITYKIDPAGGLGILTLNQCIYNDLYKETLQAFFQEVKDQDIQNIAIDLRQNSGGNSMVVDEFFRYLDVDQVATFGGANIRFGPYLAKFSVGAQPNEKFTDLTYTGKIYILTSPKTFSSATDFGAAISDNRLGEIVGETSGNMPTSYGDVLAFMTPNTQLIFYVSHKQFFRVDQSKNDLPLIPDYEVPADQALEKVLELVK